MSTKRSKKTIDHDTQKLLSFKMRVRLTEKAKVTAHRIFGVQRLAYNDALKCNGAVTYIHRSIQNEK